MILNKLHLNRVTLAELLQIALPMVVSQGTFAVMTFTDRYFLSQLSPAHMAAALGGGVATFFSFCFFSGLLSYTNAMAAQYLGSEQLAKCSKVVTQGLIVTAGCLPVLGIIAFFVSDIFAAMQHDPQQVELERLYYLVLMAGSGITLAKICLSSYFAGISRTRVVMVCDIIGLLVNVPLSYAMIFGHFGFPAMGILGAGLSTIIATTVSLTLFVCFYLGKRHREKFHVLQPFHFDRGILRRFLRLGLPSGFELFLNVAAFNLFLLMFQSYGVAQGASAAIVFNWDILSFIPMMGLNIGVISLIGRFVGAGNMERANEVIASGFLLGLCYSGTLALLFICLRSPMVEVFAPPGGDFSEIRELATFMMIGLSSYCMADSIILVSGGVLRGAGDTRWLFYTSTSLHWAMLVAQFFIIQVFEMGPRTSWLAFVSMLFAIAIVYVLRLRGGRWRDPAALRMVMAE